MGFTAVTTTRFRFWIRSWDRVCLESVIVCWELRFAHVLERDIQDVEFLGLDVGLDMARKVSGCGPRLGGHGLET